MTYSDSILHSSLPSFSAGQSGPKSPFFGDESALEHKDPHTLGSSMFDAEEFEGGIRSLDRMYDRTNAYICRVERPLHH